MNVIPASLGDEIRSLQQEPKKFDLGERIKCIREGQLLVNLSGLSLKSVPPSVLEITDVHHLDLSLNHLYELPDLSPLQDLISISLRCNSFESFPDSLFKINLLKINLEDNELSSLTDRFDELKELLFLDLTLNKLSELPPSFSKMGDLMKLDLQRNRFEIFPEEIVSLLRLRTLDLSLNKLKTIPAQLSQLKKMRYLDLSANNLGEIPIPLVKFTEMAFFDVSQNENVVIPDRIPEFYDNKFITGLFGKKEKFTEVQITRTHKGETVDLTLHNRIQGSRKDKSVDWDSLYGLESHIPQEEYKSEVTATEFADYDEYLERKFLLIDF